MINNWYKELEKIKELKLFKYFVHVSILAIFSFLMINSITSFLKDDEVHYPIKGKINQVDLEEYAIYIKINDEWFKFYQELDFPLERGDHVIIEKIKQSDNVKILINDSVKFEYPSEMISW